MGVRNYVKNTLKTNSNIKGWVSWDVIKENGKVVGRFIKDLKPSEDDAGAPKSMTFKEAVTQLGLSESDIQSRMQKHWWVSIGCALFGLIAFIWTILLLIKVMLLSCLVALSLSALMFAYAFQENFRYYQMKQRRLDCTMNEWLLSFLSSKK